MGIDFTPQEFNDSGVNYGFRSYDAELQKIFTIDIFPKQTDKSFKVTLVPVMGPAQREFATQEKIDPLHTGQENIKSDKSVKLPAMALSRLNWELDITRWSRADFRRINWSSNLDRVRGGMRPVPYSVLYQLDIWTKYRSTMNQILQKIIQKFARREIWFKVNLGEEWGEIRVPIKMMFGGPQELTDYELEEMEDRTIRSAFSFVLQCWIPTETYLIPTVTKLLVDEQQAVTSDGQVETTPVVFELNAEDRIP